MVPAGSCTDSLLPPHDRSCAELPLCATLLPPTFAPSPASLPVGLLAKGPEREAQRSENSEAVLTNDEPLIVTQHGNSRMTIRAFLQYLASTARSEFLVNIPARARRPAQKRRAFTVAQASQHRLASEYSKNRFPVPPAPSPIASPPRARTQPAPTPVSRTGHLRAVWQGLAPLTLDLA